MTLLAGVCLGAGAARAEYPWPASSSSDALERRVPTPNGFVRVPLAEGSFGAFLRALPVLEGRPHVLLYDGRRKANQGAHELVVDLDVGSRDLQQCADAVIRLRAEYLWSAGRFDDVCFRFTSGEPAPWRQWRMGEGGGRASFRRYLDRIFQYAGTVSLQRELREPPPRAAVEPGDVFVKGGHPGHAVIVLDVAVHSAGERRFLLGQSYMPAQQFHVLRNPADPRSPWYRPTEVLLTPEWRFHWRDRRRFSENGCP